MLVRIDIDNFKALNNFSIELTPLTVLIGENSTGKSSVLHAIDLVAHFAYSDLNNFLEKRNWKVMELKSKLCKKKHIVFKLHFKVMMENKEYHLTWKIVLAVRTKRGRHELFLVEEIIKNQTTNKQILKRNDSTTKLYSSSRNTVENSFLIASDKLTSIIGIVQLKDFPELIQIKNILDGVNFYGLLSAERMRRSSRGQANSIGNQGELLAAYLGGLHSLELKKIIKKINDYFKSIQSLKIRRDPIEGWVTFDVIEKYLNEEEIVINVKHLSDGVLRVIAFIAVLTNNIPVPYLPPKISTESGQPVSLNLLPTEYEYSFFLLEEIENGINPHLAGVLLEYMLEVSEKKNRQVLLTTHSPIVLNYVPVENIVYLWRNSSGNIGAEKVFDRDEIKRYLEYMNPGEIWMNFEEEELLNHRN